MSATSGDKQSKSKSKKSTSMKSTKQQPKGKEAAVNIEKFRGDGVSFKCKLLGVAEVAGPRGDNMCIEAIKKLKHHIKQTGEHKQKIILNVTLKGIRIFDEKSKNLVFEHPVNKISFITHDTDDKKIFGYICSARGKTGHRMYAIKYDKVAGVITATLYELFQAVFKLRQDAANQKRAQANNQSNVKANNVAVSNGPSAASPVDENNIYEDPEATTPSPVKNHEDNTSDGHYKVPLSRPLPPAPYASSASSASYDSPKIGHHDIKTNQPQTADSPGTSFPSESFFGASVFTQSDSASDSVSMSSVDIPRKESISSSSSEATSFDTRSLDLKTGHSASTPPTGRGGFASPEGTVSHISSETGTIPEEDHDYETIPSTDYDTIPSRVEKKDVVQAEFKGFDFKESSSNIEPFPRSDSLNDPSVAKTSSVQEKPAAGAFGDDDLFKCFGDSNFDDMALANSNKDFPMDDPFAPRTVTMTQESQSQATDAFNSDPFEAAFGPGNMSPLPFGSSKQPDIVDSSVENTSEDMTEDPTKGTPVTSRDRFQAAFGTAEMSPPPFKPENIQKNEEKDIGNTEQGSTFDSVKNSIEVEDKKSEKSEESKVEFQWGFDSVKEKEPLSGSSADVKDEISWSAAFDDKQPKTDVTFSWDDAFGAPVDSKDEETKNDFGGIHFGDAFVSTPFTKESSSKVEPSFLDDSFSSFGAVDLKPDIQEQQKVKDIDSKDEVSMEVSTEDRKEGYCEETLSKDTENENKPTLVYDEDLSSSDKENGSKSDKVTIPKVVEPISEDQNDDLTSGESIRPTSIPIQPIKPKQNEDNSPDSPDAPPPLPPRTMTALPVLPPRPRTFSSPVSAQIPPTPPRPAVASGRDSPAMKGKRLPPALPPRIDLEIEKTRTHSNPPVPLSTTGFNPDAFSSPKNGATSISWQANWEHETPKESKDKENVINSKTSPDPFGDDFFTDFNLSAAKDTSSKPNEATLNNQDFFADPFLAKEGTNDMFKADFGGEDPFANFSNNKGNNDPFMLDEDSAFSGFSTNKDPFSDVNDPFADKTAVNDDPFGSNTNKNESESMSFHLSKDSSDGDFTDSFA